MGEDEKMNTSPVSVPFRGNRNNTRNAIQTEQNRSTKLSDGKPTQNRRINGEWRQITANKKQKRFCGEYLRKFLGEVISIINFRFLFFHGGG